MRIIGKRIHNPLKKEFNGSSYSTLLNTIHSLSGSIPLARGQMIRFNNHEDMNKHMEDAIVLRMERLTKNSVNPLALAMGI